MSKKEKQALTKENMLIRNFLQNKSVSQEEFDFLVSYLTEAVAAEISSIIGEVIVKILKQDLSIELNSKN